MMKIGTSPVLAPKAKLLNVRLVQLHSFKALISWIGIPKNHPGEEMEKLRNPILSFQ